MHSVAILVGEGFQALDVAGPFDVFAEANAIVGGAARYALSVVGRRSGPLAASNGMLLHPHASVGDAAGPFSTVLVAGGPDLPDAAPDAAAGAWLRAWAPRAARHGSICTGAFTLGHAGLLDGRCVTTHWRSAGRLAELFPAARVEADRIAVRDGALVTSAGITAGIDLALSLVAEDHGPAVSLQCAKSLLVVAQRQGGQSQFSPFLPPPSGVGSALSRVQAHVMAHLAEPLSVGRLAEVAGMSERSVARLFAEQLGLTPRAFVERARVDAARHRLEAGDEALKAVAFACGFGSSERMRVVFRLRLGVTPIQYRATFRRSRGSVSGPVRDRAPVPPSRLPS